MTIKTSRNTFVEEADDMLFLGIELRIIGYGRWPWNRRKRIYAQCILAVVDFTFRTASFNAFETSRFAVVTGILFRLKYALQISNDERRCNHFAVVLLTDKASQNPMPSEPVISLSRLDCCSSPGD